MPKNISRYLREFLENLKQSKGRTEKTIENYRFYMSRFIDFFGDKKPDRLTVDTIKRYRKWLGELIDARGEPLKKNTQNYHLIALRNFLRYLQSKKITTLSHREIKLDQINMKKPSVLGKTDLERLLDAPLKDKTAGKNDTLSNHRNKAVLELLFSTGMLVSEIAKLKKTDINLNKNELSLLIKKNKQKTVPLSEQARYWIKQYLNLRKDSNPYLFIPHDKRAGKNKDKGITPRTVQRIVNKCAKSAGLQKNITPHSFRHSYTLSMIKSGVSVENIKKTLGLNNDNSSRYC